MLKKLMSAALAVVLLAGVARAAEGTVAGKVVAVEEGKVKIAVTGEKPAWLKAEARVKFTGATGTVLEVEKNVVTVKSKLAEKVKAGDAVSFEKAKAIQGC